MGVLQYNCLPVSHLSPLMTTYRRMNHCQKHLSHAHRTKVIHLFPKRQSQQGLNKISKVRVRKVCKKDAMNCKSCYVHMPVISAKQTMTHKRAKPREVSPNKDGCLVVQNSVMFCKELTLWSSGMLLCRMKISRTIFCYQNQVGQLLSCVVTSRCLPEDL